ncbi:uncharacterized protein DS421_6g194360 [Arachis hypogaea]|nr:uncharacterized protein DS421_6g194360 [Arachis hypogaea]
MRKKVATQRDTGSYRTPKNLPPKDQVHIHIHIHIHSYSSSHSFLVPKTMPCTKTTSRRLSTSPPEARTSRANAKGKKPMTEEEPSLSLPICSSSRLQRTFNTLEYSAQRDYCPSLITKGEVSLKMNCC